MSQCVYYGPHHMQQTKRNFRALFLTDGNMLPKKQRPKNSPTPARRLIPMEEGYEIIETLHFAEKAKDDLNKRVVDQFSELSKIAERCTTRAEFDNLLKPAEIRFMEVHYSADETAKYPNSKRSKKAGQWKFSRLPKAYRTAKSSLGVALEKGVTIAPGVGKTELERRCKDLDPATVLKGLERIAKQAVQLNGNRAFTDENVNSKILDTLDTIRTMVIYSSKDDS